MQAYPHEYPSTQSPLSTMGPTLGRVMDLWSTHTCAVEGGKRASLIALIMTTVGSPAPVEDLLGFYVVTVSLLLRFYLCVLVRQSSLQSVFRV